MDVCKYSFLGRGTMLAAVLFGCAAGAAEARREMPPAVVQVDTVGEMTAGENKKYVGLIKAVYDVGLIARVSGNIMKQNVPHGAFVEKDQVLFELEDTTYRAAVDAARGKVQQWEAEVNYAECNLQRHTTLKTQQAVAVSSYEEAVRVAETAKAQLAQARAALVEAEDNLQYTRVRSPVKGRMGKGTYSPGNYVTANSSRLATVVSIDPVNVDFAISQRDFLALFGSIDATRQYADIRLVLADGSNYPGRGRVVFVDNKVDSSTDTLTVRAEFDNPDYKLIPGGLVNVLLSRSGRKYPVIPVTAVMTDRAGNYVYVVGPDNTVIRRNVRMGSISGELQAVLSGVRTGETVISDGMHKTRPGFKVEPVASGVAVRNGEK